MLTFTMTWALVAQVSTQQHGPSGPPAVPTTVSARPIEDLSGRWKYNPEQSVNAATGRLETARAANDRRGAGAGGGGPRGGGGGIGGGGFGFPSVPGGLSEPGNGGLAGGGGGGGGGFGGNLPPSVALNMYQLSRDTLRDLMEIPPGLSFTVTESSVTWTDDLDRSLTFPTDGRKQKYMLGAATFEARTSWDGPKLKIDIAGPNSLKLNQTLFLSEDGSRLFVIIRVGQPEKGEPPTGVNRVYDRVK